MTKQQLASKIWETANSLRSKIKANEYKDYILGFMFYKYLSDEEEKQFSKEDLKKVDEDDIAYIKDKIGYYIAYEDLFSTWKDLELKLGAAEVSEALTGSIEISRMFIRKYLIISFQLYKVVYQNLEILLAQEIKQLEIL